MDKPKFKVGDEVLLVIGENSALVLITHIGKGSYYYVVLDTQRTWFCPVEEFDYESRYLTKLERALK